MLVYLVLVEGNEGMEKKTETSKLTVEEYTDFQNNQQVIWAVEGRVLATLIAEVRISSCTNVTTMPSDNLAARMGSTDAICRVK